MAQDTGKFRTNSKDQFYTAPAVAAHCIHVLQSKVSNTSSYRWIEPSAGTGAFFSAIPAGVERIGVDIEPKAPGILQQEFLSWTPPPTTRRTLLIGNPPFGRQSALAKAFILKGCAIADVIAFILPLSFVKPSMSNAFDAHFHCIHSEELGRNSFLLNGEPYDVPCVFQIWERRPTPRPPVEKIVEQGFRYVKPDQPFHLAFRRVGVFAGRCYPSVADTTFSAQSHHFLVFDAPYVPHLEAIAAAINAHTFPSNTVGPRSLSKPEINAVINGILATLSV